MSCRWCGGKPLQQVRYLFALPLFLASLPPTSALSAQGALGAEFRVNTYTTSNQSYPSAAADASGNFVVAWASYGQDGSSFGIFAQRFDGSGAAVGLEFLVNVSTAFSQFQPSVAMDPSGNFIVAWQDAYGILARRFDATGGVLAGEFPVNTYPASSQARPAVAMGPGGSFVVVWQSLYQDGDNLGVFAQRFDGSGARVGAEFQVNTYTTGGQELPKAAVNASGAFVVAWGGIGLSGSYSDIHLRRFDATGAPLGPEFRANTYTTGRQSRPALAMDANGNFVVAWESLGQDGNSYGIFAQRFDAAGIAQGAEFAVNTLSFNAQYEASAAMDASGNFVVAWRTLAGEDISAQRFDAVGNRVGPEFVVNSYTTGVQWAPSAAMDSTGRFVVAWNALDESLTGVFARRFERLPTLSIGDTSVVEGDAGTTPATFSVVLSPASDEQVTVTYATADGTAMAGSDYVAVSGTLTFSPGATTQSLDVAVVGDTLDESGVGAPSETFYVNLLSGTNAAIADGQGVGTILNDDSAPGAPSLDPVPDGVITVGATKILTGANFTAGTVIKLFVNTGGSIVDVSGSGGFAPSAFTFNSLTWDIPATVPLGQGFGALFVVNTDQGFATSNTQYALLYGDPPDNLPTILSVNGTPLSSTLDPGVPVAHTDTVVASGRSLAVEGTGFNNPGVNIFGAQTQGADPAPTPDPCPVTNYGPAFPGGASTTLVFSVPAMPAGPANIQVVNDPYAGNVQSNSVSAIMGARPTINSVSITGDELTVVGAGFSCLSVINLFNLQGGTTVVNLGGLTGGGQRVVPIQFISSTELRFTRPAGAQAGPAFVEVLNPPYIPFSSSGNAPAGGFSFP
jgi:hypothetical protein